MRAASVAEVPSVIAEAEWQPARAGACVWRFALQPLVPLMPHSVPTANCLLAEFAVYDTAPELCPRRLLSQAPGGWHDPAPPATVAIRRIREYIRAVEIAAQVNLTAARGSGVGPGPGDLFLAWNASQPAASAFPARGGRGGVSPELFGLTGGIPGAGRSWLRWPRSR